ncbi:MAG: prepilin-type N-terminal cleavage/methylation domain-containing protein [Candidatus Sumerlaeaceae bacterium]
MSQSKSNAFTLIELLIVVAIIAILAAIAVPNFLEAQVRAKASRAKNDLRSIVTAAESYAVDNNKYPIPRFIAFQTVGGLQSTSQFLPGGPHPIDGGSGPLVGGLTSPVAYLTSTLKDVFTQQTFDQNHNDLGYQNIQHWIDVGCPTGMNEPGNPTQLPTTIAGTNPPESFTDRYGLFIVRSLGPQKTYVSVINPYDPTNGTTSRGNIYRTQKRAKNASSVGSE